MKESFVDRWTNVIKDTPLNSREPMWDQAIKYLMAEGAMEPTVYDTLTQGQIQEIILDKVCDEIHDERYPENISDLFQEFGKWLARISEERRFYIIEFTDGNELWLAYLMSVYYAMEWDGEQWKEIARCKKQP